MRDESPNSYFIGVWLFGDVAVGHPARQSNGVSVSESECSFIPVNRVNKPLDVVYSVRGSMRPVGRRRRRRRARAPGRGLRRLWQHSRARSCISAAQALVGHSCPERASGARLPWDAIGCSGSSRHHPNDAQGPSASLSVPALVHAVTRSNVSR